MNPTIVPCPRNCFLGSNENMLSLTKLHTSKMLLLSVMDDVKALTEALSFSWGKLGMKPLPWGLTGSVLLKNIFSIWKSTTLNKMAISEFWLDVFGEMMGVGGGLVALQSLSTIKEGTSPLICNRMSLFWSFYENAVYKNLICPQGIT